MESYSFLYIANKDQYLREAVKSVESAKRHMPNIDIVLATPVENSEYHNMFNHVLRMPDDDSKWFLRHSRYMGVALRMLDELGYDRTVFMDTDTFFVDSVYELFEMLDFYDFMGAHAPARYTGKTVEEIPLAFPEINIGVNPMRTGEVTRGFWINVINQFSRNIGKVYHNNDQGPLREVLWNYAKARRNFRFAILPPEYNCRFDFPCFVGREVKILHGRSQHQTIESVADTVNRDKGMRAWKTLN